MDQHNHEQRAWDVMEAAPEVCLTFIDAKQKVYLSVSGWASVVRNAKLAERLWNRNQEVWWNGPTDPNLRVLRVEPELAEFWDRPASSAVAAHEFAKTRRTGERAELGGAPEAEREYALMQTSA